MRNVMCAIALLVLAASIVRADDVSIKETDKEIIIEYSGDKDGAAGKDQPPAATDMSAQEQSVSTPATPETSREVVRRKGRSTPSVRVGEGESVPVPAPTQGNEEQN